MSCKNELNNQTQVTTQTTGIVPAPFATTVKVNVTDAELDQLLAQPIAPAVALDAETAQFPPNYERCLKIKELIRRAPSVKISWHPEDLDTLFYIGIAFGYNKPVTVGDLPPLVNEGKGFQNMITRWGEQKDLVPLPITAEPDQTFLICPVRGHNPEETRAVVERIEKEGYQVHWPPRDTKQVDETGGYRICVDNRAAVLKSEVIHIIWDGKSQGGLFDIGMTFAANKPIRNVGIPAEEEKKPFANFLRTWRKKQLEESLSSHRNGGKFLPHRAKSPVRNPNSRSE